jgi:hypothetical protein
VNFSSLDPEDFLFLVRELFRAEGYKTLRLDERAHDVGVDFAFSDPSIGEKKAIVECKVGGSEFGLSRVMESADRLEQTRDYLQAHLAYLVTGGQLTASARDYVDDQSSIILWDRGDIERLLEKHPDVGDRFVQHLAEIEKRGRLVLNANPTATRAKELSNRLVALPSGLEQWREYEDIVIEILTFLFFPDLGVPAIQSTSEDGLDRRDAIYPIQQKEGYWQTIRREFSSRFVVAEFKSHTTHIGQKEVESIVPVRRNTSLPGVGSWPPTVSAMTGWPSFRVE